MNEELKLKRLWQEAQEEKYWAMIGEQWKNEGIDPNDNEPLEQSVDHKHYTVRVKDKIYELSWDMAILGSGKRMVEVNFRLKNLHDFKNSNFDTGITGTGNVMEVFNKIINTIVTLAEKDKVDYINFMAREEKRQKLYKILIKEVLKKMPRFKEIDISPLTHETFDETEFWLERI